MPGFLYFDDSQKIRCCKLMEIEATLQREEKRKEKKKKEMKNSVQKGEFRLNLHVMTRLP